MQIVMSTPYDDIDSSLIDCIHIIRLYKYLSSSNLAVIHKTVVRKLIEVIRKTSALYMTLDVSGDFYS